MRGVGVALLCALAVGCTHTEWEADFHRPHSGKPMSSDAPFLKVHTHDGHVHVVRDWRLEPKEERVAGEGLEYDADRRLIAEGRQQVPFDDIVLLETNRPRTVIKAGAPILGVASGASAAMTLFCAASPKTCFGSCPTFYARTDAGSELLAEGFSASVARALEATDVDSLHGARSAEGRFDLEMRNEALETHFVRSARLLVVPTGEGTVMRAGGAFHRVGEPVSPRSCRGAEGDCTDAVRALDEVPYASRTDPEDLGAREEVHLVFPALEGPRALVVAGRNSLVQTFLFYRFIASLGPDAGRWFANLERDGGETARHALALQERINPIRVDVRDAQGRWREVGAYDEVGPIARDVQLVPLPSEGGPEPVEVRLRLTRGYWKLDWAGLVPLGKRVRAVELRPRAVSRARGHLGPDEALARLRDPERHLMTLPGERYVLRYEVPEGRHALFLKARGYYYEWQREGWLDHHDPVVAARFVVDPDGALERLAPAYKRIETEADRVFRNSRVGPGGAQ